MSDVSLTLPGIRVEREVGRGIQGVVYDASLNERRVLVRLPREGVRSDERELRAFRREVCAVARIPRHGLPRVESLGEAQGVPFAVLEAVSGLTIEQRVADRGLISEDCALRIASELAAAIFLIHHFGFRHGPMTPRSVVIDANTGACRPLDYEPSVALPSVPGASQPLTSGAGRIDRLVGVGEILAWAHLGASSRDEVESLLQKKPESRANILIRRLLGIQAEQVSTVRELLPLLSYPVDLPMVEPSLVGRGAELSEVLASESRSEQNRISVVRGVAGVGKSRLVSELFARHQAQPDVVVLTAGCQSWDPRPFSVVRQLVESFLQEGSGDQESRRAALRRSTLRRATPDLSSLLAVLSPELADSAPEVAAIRPTEDSERVFVERLAALLHSVLEGGARTIVLVEDLQWLDEASRKVLKRAIDRSRGLDVRFVVTARDDAESRANAQRLLGQVTPHVDITLQPLSATEVDSLISGYLGERVLSSVHRKALAYLSDSTPLSVLEVLQTVVDAGVLWPSGNTWELDVKQVARLSLPSASRGILARRLGALEGATLRVLQCAATIGVSFELSLLGAATGLRVEALNDVLVDARRAQLVRVESAENYSFVHHSIQEVLLAELEGQERATLHAKVGQALLRASEVNLVERGSNELYALAWHSAQGLSDEQPELAFASNLEAGRRAFAAFDNQRALSFLRVAADLEAAVSPESGAPTRSHASDYPLGYLIPEATLRRGDIIAALSLFRSQLDVESDPLVRARILSRVAYIHEIRMETAEAWSACEGAFEELGLRMPEPGIQTVWGVASRLTSQPRTAQTSALESPTGERLEILCALYHLYARVAVLEEQSSRVIDGLLRYANTAEKLGASADLSRAYASVSLVLTLLGRKKLARRYLVCAEEMATQLEEPGAMSHCLQLFCVSAGWAGDLEESLRVGARALNEFGNWMPLHEYWQMAFTLEVIEGWRGRGRHGWHWLEKAIEKVLPYEGSPVVSDSLLLTAQAVGTYLGRDRELAGTLDRVRAVCVPAPTTNGSYWWGFAQKIRRLVESGELGSEFERLVDEFNEAELNPKRVHIIAAGAYLFIAQARLHQFLASPADQHRQRQLRAALTQLAIAARVQLLEAHHAAISGCLEALSGSVARSEELFGKASAMAHEENAPWVLYTVARGRAHRLKADGRLEAALDQARLAETLCERHGAVHRQRWIREEIGITELLPEPTSQRESRGPADAVRSQRRVRAFMKISEAATRRLDPVQQAQLVLDEMIATLDAEAGVLLLREHTRSLSVPIASLDDLELLASREAGGGDLLRTEMLEHPELLDSIRLKVVQVFSHDDSGRSLVATPLMMLDQVVGLACLSAPMAKTQFTKDDGELVAALASQVPAIFQLAYAARDRERLSEDLRHAQKMEAVGRLAGGIAHDFNNMLAAIRISADEAMVGVQEQLPITDDLKTIQGAAERAAQLTSQLLAFSRRQVFEMRALDLNAAVRELGPMLARLLGDDVEVRCVDLEASLFKVLADSAQLEQAIVNLAVNARDAMPDGGTLTIRTQNQLFPRQTASGLPAGEYAVLSLIDTGVGMTEEVRQRIFEPFFTTKGEGVGTGLGLAMVDGVVRQCAGSVEVESAPGLGTTFRIYLPRTTQEVEPLPQTKSYEGPLTGDEQILLVEDERLVRRALARILTRLGYQVTAAASGERALTAVATGTQPDLVITDVIMPGMNGVELVRRLGRRGVQAKVLYISGFADGVVTSHSSLGDEVAFMQKPISHSGFTTEVRRLLDLPPAPGGSDPTEAASMRRAPVDRPAE